MRVPTLRLPDRDAGRLLLSYRSDAARLCQPRHGNAPIDVEWIALARLPRCGSSGKEIAERYPKELVGSIVCPFTILRRLPDSHSQNGGAMTLPQRRLLFGRKRLRILVTAFWTLHVNWIVRLPRLRDVLCRVLREVPDANNWSEYPNMWEEAQRLLYNCEWFKVYDFI
jgi:hypothetical protein